MVKTKIFVGQLPEGCKSSDLQTLFEKYGAVTECDVINKYGFVHMSSSDEAAEAIKSLNSTNFMGSVIHVEPSTSKLHLEPGAPGRAKGPGGPMGRGGARNGFQGRDSYYNNSFFDGPRSMYFDRPPMFGRDRARPYPMPYERRGPPMPLPRDDMYSRRSVPLPPGRDDLYGRRGPPSMMGRDDPYERRAMRDRPLPDYLYSRRSPPMGARPDSFGAPGDDWYPQMQRF